MLIVALGVLTLMSLLAVTFATIIRMERAASENYMDSVRAKILAESGVERAIAECKQTYRKRDYTSETDCTAPVDASGNKIVGKPIEEKNFPGMKGDLGSSHPIGAEAGDIYKVKVFSCASQINLNGRQETLGAMLTTLGQELARSGKENPFPPTLVYVPPSAAKDSKVKPAAAGDAVVSYRSYLPDGRFQTKSQLRDFIGKDAFDVVCDYVTTTGWRDPQAVAGTLRNAVGGVDYHFQERYPVDVNAATEEVLTACLDGLGARFKWVLGTGLGMQPILWEGKSPGREETALAEEVIWVYIRPLNRKEAQQIAGNIVASRKSCGGAITSMEHLYDLFNRLDDSALPSPDEASVVGSNLPSGTSIKDVVGNEEFRGYHRKAVASMLKANFNPNAVANNFNPNAPAYMPCSKADLFKKAEHSNLDSTEIVPGHTTEFCFGSMGYFEIVSLGQVLGKSSPAEIEAQVWAQSKIMQVVKIFEVKRHTAQSDFEDPWAKGSGTITLPEPMQVLRKIYAAKKETDIYRGDLYTGYLELEPSTKENYLAPKKYFTASFKNGLDADTGYRKELDDKYFEEAYPNHKPPVSGPIIEKGPLVGSAGANNDLFPDGINHSIFRRSTPKIGVYRARARTNRQQSDLTEEGNIGFRAGAIEMWIKPEFDTSTKIFSGYFGATYSIANDHGYPSGRKGTQMYFFKNTDGMLRVTRMYYEICYDERGEVLPRGVDLHDWDFYPWNEKMFTVPDKTILYPRMELYIRPQTYGGWKAHEWHHVFISWNDTKAQMGIWIDGKKMPVEPVTFGHYGRGEFVHLNCRRPTDEFMLGGIYRYQHFTGAGLFKFKPSGAIDRGAQRWVYAGSNATIRDVMTYHPDQEPAAVQDRLPINIIYMPNTNEKPSRYRQSATFTNRFKIDFPPGVNRVKLGSVSWTSYKAPDSFGGGGHPDGKEMKVDTEGEHLLIKVNGVPVEGNGKTPGKEDMFVKATNPYVEYSVTFMPYTVRGEDRDVFSPVLDDITITYFLPKEKVILFEKITE
jgi:hypothetical protein